MGDGREHLERPDWYDEAGAWRTATERFAAPKSDPKPEMHVTVRNVANDGP